MGQYYRMSVLKKNWKLAKQPIAMSLSPYEFDNGAKLTEFSYVDNNLMKAIEWLIANKFNGMPFVCVGDYADEKITHAYPETRIDEWYKTEVGMLNLYNKANDLIDNDKPNSRYQRIKSEIPDYDKLPTYKYIVNLSKKEYVVIPDYNPKKWVMHPLPLLCADGNGRGGGDYRSGKDIDKVGRWAYDRIYITNDDAEIKGYKKLSVNFKEVY